MEYKVIKELLDEIESQMVESAYMCNSEFGKIPDMNELFDDTLSHLLKNLKYEIEQGKKGVTRSVRHRVNSLLGIDDSDEIIAETIADGEMALDGYLSSLE